MKKILFFALLFTSFHSFAQKKSSSAIKLVKGQRISVTTTNNSDADMGMGTMKNNSVNTNIIIVTGENDNEYQLTNTVTKVKMDLDGMGSTMTYDSEKPEDKDSEIGKSLSEVIGKPLNISLNKISGTATFEKKESSPEKPEKNPLEDMIGGFGSNNDPSVTGAFLLIPAGKKAGDTWTVTDSTKEKQSTKTYTINSIQGNIAVISFTSVSNTNGTIDANGTEMNITTNTKSTGDISVDIKTGLVNKSSSVSDITASLDVMGQTMPVTAKSSSVSVYTPVAN
jgi:hypothetical protein